MIYSAIITNGVLKCSTAISPQGPKTAVPLSAACGYDAVSLTIKSPADYDIPTLKQLLSDNGLYVNALATGQIYTVDGLSMGSGSEENRRLCVERLCSLADLCSELGGAKLIIGAVRGRTGDAPSPLEYHRRFEKSLRELCRYAEERGVEIILELIDHLESDCCCKTGELLSYLDRIGSENLRMYLDTMHLYYENEDICGIIEKYARAVPQIDISGENRLSPTESHIDFEAVFKTIRQSGFDGVINMEFDCNNDSALHLQALEFAKRFLE